MGLALCVFRMWTNSRQSFTAWAYAAGGNVIPHRIFVHSVRISAEWVLWRKRRTESSDGLQVFAAEQRSTVCEAIRAQQESSTCSHHSLTFASA